MHMYKLIKKYLVSSLAVLLSFFLMAFFITEYFYNAYNAKYVYIFSSDAENISEVLTKEYFDSVISEIDEYNKTADKKISYADIEYEEMLKSSELRENGNYELVVLMKYFPNTIKSNGLINQSENRIVKYLNLIFSYSDKNVEFIELKIEKYVNPFIVGGIASGVGLILVIGFMGIFINLIFW